MDAIQREVIERKLLWERDHLRKETTTSQNDGTPQAGVAAPAEPRARYAITEIDAALLRLANSQYGACLACGRKIVVERLQLVPATRFCLRCARKFARKTKSWRAEPKRGTN